jgi:hypothetical protein
MEATQEGQLSKRESLYSSSGKCLPSKGKRGWFLVFLYNFQDAGVWGIVHEGSLSNILQFGTW